jgi:hypothetical protein
MVVGALPTGSVTSSHRQSSEPHVVHDHIRLGQHQVGPIACIVLGISTGYLKHAGTAECSETVGGPSCGRELGSVGRLAEMISDRRADPDRKVLIKRVGENLRPTAQAW